MKPIFAIVFAAVALTGCNASHLAAAPKVPATLAARATLNITGPSGYRILTLTAWNRTDIDHVSLALYKEGVATGAAKTVANAALGSPVTLTNLRYGTTYKVVARAWADAAGTTEIDNIVDAGSDSACSTTFTTPSLVAATAGDNVSDGAVAIAIPVRLKDKTFAGQAAGSTGVGVTNGTIVNTTAAESF
jgi:hypothetical protein